MNFHVIVTYKVVKIIRGCIIEDTDSGGRCLYIPMSERGGPAQLCYSESGPGIVLGYNERLECAATYGKFSDYVVRDRIDVPSEVVDFVDAYRNYQKCDGAARRFLNGILLYSPDPPQPSYDL